MEREFFTWVSWDAIDTASFSFNDVVLTKKIGQFEVGTKFSGAYIDFDKGTLELREDEDGDIYHKFKLKLSIVE